MSDHEDEKWRVSFVRILLCIAMLFYLAMLAALPISQPNTQETYSLVSLSSFVGVSAFAALALNRMRRSSIAAIGLLALFAAAAIVRSSFYLRVPFAPVRTKLDVIDDVGVLIAIATMGLPIIAFIVAWLLRHVTSKVASSADLTADSSTVRSNPPADPPA
jgi:hypothetical protein